MTHYTIRRAYGSYDCLKVTKETPRMIYGSIDGVGTHAKPAHCVGRFGTEDACKAAIARVRAIYQEHEHLIRAAQAALDNTRDCRDAAIERFLAS